MAITTEDLVAGVRAVAPLPDRGFLRVTGPDATRWLNGMVTNSITALAPGEGSYNFLLNAQGRIVGDCTLYRDTTPNPASFLLASTATQLLTIQPHLDHFIIMDDVELTPAFTDDASLLLLGPEAPSLLTAAGLPTPSPLRLVHADTPDGPILLFTPAATADALPRFELRASIAALRQKLLAAGAAGAVGPAEASPGTLEALRIYQASPLYGTDIRNTDTARDLPQETAQTHALHFAKGCYLGQEIVERIRSRGQVHRQFTRFRLTGQLPSSLPAPLELDGKPAGELTSAALVPLPSGDALFALGYVRREALPSNSPLSYPGGAALASSPGSV